MKKFFKRGKNYFLTQNMQKTPIEVHWRSNEPIFKMVVQPCTIALSKAKSVAELLK